MNWTLSSNKASYQRLIVQRTEWTRVHVLLSETENFDFA